MAQIIRNRMDAIDFLKTQAQQNGISMSTLSSHAGYSFNHLTAATQTGAISLQALADYLEVLGLQLTVASPSDDGH